MIHGPIPDHPHAALRDALLAARPDPTGAPSLSEVVPSLDGGLDLNPVDIEPARWARRGTEWALADLVALIRYDPWPYTHVLGYLLVEPGLGHVWAADRVGTVLDASLHHAPPTGVGLTVDPTCLGPVPRLLRTMTLAVNGPAVPSTAPPLSTWPTPAAGPAPCLFVGPHGPLAEAMAHVSITAGADLRHRTPNGLDVASWRAAQVIFLATDTACLDVAVRMPARPGIVLLGTEPTPAGLVEAARVLGVENTAVWPADERWLHQRLAAATRAAHTAAQTLTPGGDR